jgi:hypothetical protein
MGMSEALKNAGLTAMAALITHVGLADETDELPSGGDYARQAVSWGSASAGAIAITGTETFDVPGGSTVNRLLLRDTATIDDHSPDYGYAELTEEVFGGDGSYTLNSLTLTLTDPS